MKILKTIDEVRNYASIQSDTEFSDLEPKFLQAARKWVVPMVGQDLADAVVDYYNDGNPDEGDAANMSLLYKMQEAVVNLGLLLYIPEANVQVGSRGLLQNINENSQAAPWWAVKDAARSFGQAGEEALDAILEYLEANADSFPEWDTSAESTEHRLLLVGTAGEFQKIHNIFKSRRTFEALASIIHEVQDLYLDPSIGSAVLQEFIEMEAPNTEQAHALTLLKKTLVHFTVARACKTNLFTITADGMRSRQVMTVNSFIDKMAPAEKESVEKLEAEKLRTANAYLSRLINYLNEKASDTLFTTWKNSDKYVSPEDAGDPSLTHNTTGFLGI